MNLERVFPRNVLAPLAPPIFEALKGVSLDEPADVRRVARRLLEDGLLVLPAPGSGRTQAHHDTLAELGAVDLSLARLCEGHSDATTIAAELGGNPPSRNTLYGVWAAEPPDGRLEATRTEAGWRLCGKKRYATGAGFIDRALVTAHAKDGPRLFDIDVKASGVRPIEGTWPALGMNATGSLDVAIDVEIAGDLALGKPSSYVTRPGFEHGGIRVAACWFGGALGALRMLARRLGSGPVDEHAAAHFGAMVAECSGMLASLDAAAEAIDADPGDEAKLGKHRTLIVRQLIERGCQEVLTRVGRASGSSALVFDRAHGRRAADLVVYLRQHHAERDLARLGRSFLEEGSRCRR